ncbi:hypothetical protein GCM10027034_41250 [Ramlibacter solisilvae]|uniref:Outer membrane protein beta-barrel domain-containing protein n=1 Tax=Ramlibacter tataouinensis TaxID=94132 RepID=A0A127JTW7_9BURK|nr:hypothetical protein UC35_11235 [Ramlibacter tataouinensis]
MKDCARAVLLAAAALAGAPLWAAGGHHAVDDAIILGPGECEIESWITRSDRGNQALRLGGQCGVAGLEIGIAAEPVREAGRTNTFYGAQLKLAREFAPGWHAGLSVSPVGQTREPPRYAGTGVSALLTWMPMEALAFHLNAGRDLLHGQADQARHGAALDWTPVRAWSFTVERYLLDATHFVRAGARWFASEQWAFDLSRAQQLHGERASNWTLGLTVSLR